MQVFRFQVLVALLLSSQTKDEITAAAVEKLQTNLPKGLCVEAVLEATPEKLEKLIYPVGFYRRKAASLKRIAEILQARYDGDIPESFEDLISLPGIGPKMVISFYK